jgi:hypothetical protein
VHVIPPLDGIYAQWDFNAGVAETYYNPRHPEGVPIDGKNDEVFGNLDDPCQDRYDAENNPNDTSELDQMYRSTYEQLQGCQLPNHLSIDVTDPTYNTVNAALDWNQVSSPEGTIVDRYQIDKVTDLTPGGVAQSLAAVPYYRDDSCFDDGTGDDPGARIKPGSGSEEMNFEGSPRRCWDSAEGSGDPAVPAGDRRFFQGDIGTHGLHLMFQLESDNARLQVPIDEIVSEQRMVMLPGDQNATAGETYGRGFEKPVIATAVDPGFLTYNQSPAAEISFTPASPRKGQAVTFDASSSSDPDGTIVGYRWDLDGNGSFETDTGATAAASRTFVAAGTYTVAVRVTDDRGASDDASTQVTVVNAAGPKPKPKPRKRKRKRRRRR